MTIGEAIQRLSKDKMDNFIKGGRLCKVISVDGSACTVETVDTEVELIVRLQTEDSNGLLLKPAVNSHVVVMPMADFEFVVVMYSAIDSIQLLDGSFGGLVKIQDLVSKINAIEQKVNDINTALKTHTHTGVTVGSGVSGPSTAFSAITDLTETVVSDIENNKITHGDI